MIDTAEFRRKRTEMVMAPRAIELPQQSTSLQAASSRRKGRWAQIWLLRKRKIGDENKMLFLLLAYFTLVRICNLLRLTISRDSHNLSEDSTRTSFIMADAISIEETNRLRISLGMKPLPVPGASGPVFKAASTPEEEAESTLESRQAEGYDNYRKLREAEEARRKRDAKAEAIKKARDAAKRFSKLEGKGLGEADDDDDLDAKSWLIKQKKRQKEIEKARKKGQELAEAEAAAAAAVEYTAKDLAGVKVGHELETFQEGEEQVLVLKDTTIDEN